MLLGSSDSSQHPTKLVLCLSVETVEVDPINSARQPADFDAGGGSDPGSH